MGYDRLSAPDTAFLRIEKANQPQHVGSLSFYEGAPLRDPTGRIRIDEIRAHMHDRLHLVPRLRQRLMEVPFGAGRPIWIDDDRFDIEYHVRVTALPRPGDERQLRELVSRLQSAPLDRNRPLWEAWYVDGLADDRVAVVMRVHHALGDGIANVDLGMALLDLQPDPEPAPPAPAWEPRPAPTPIRLWRDTMVERLLRPAGLVMMAVGAARDVQRALADVRNVLDAVGTMGGPPPPAPWNVPVTRHRRWTSARVSLDQAKRTKAAAGVTLNDVVLGACTGALRTYLDEHGVAPEGGTLKTMVPVSRRQDSERGATLGNRVSLIIVDLPVGEPDPLARLARIHAQTSELKGSGLVEGAEAVTLIADQIPLLEAPATRFVAGRIPMNLVVTNIPGPPVPLYLMGARMLETFPYVEVVDNQGLTIAVVSYEGQLAFGITSDRDVMPDLDLLAEALEKSFDELADVVASR